MYANSRIAEFVVEFQVKRRELLIFNIICSLELLTLITPCGVNLTTNDHFNALYKKLSALQF